MTEAKQLSPAAAFVLTRRLPCGLLLALMIGAFAVFAGASNLPALAMLLGLAGIAMNMLAPALVALVTFGGGLNYALQVSALASLLIFTAAGFALATGILTFVVYGCVVAIAAHLFMGNDGTARSGQWLAAGLGLSVMLALIINAFAEGLDLRAYTEHLLHPFFENMQAADGDPEIQAALSRSRSMMAQVLPGLLAWAMWIVWWGDIVLAKSIALRYGFYEGQNNDVLDLHFGKPWAYLFLVALIGANLGHGDLQFSATNLALFIGGMMAVQGVMVVHSWFRARKMQFLIGLMYVMLFFWTAMIVPFVIVGLMDIWFDFRRNIDSAHGG